MLPGPSILCATPWSKLILRLNVGNLSSLHPLESLENNRTHHHIYNSMIFLASCLYVVLYMNVSILYTLHMSIICKSVMYIGAFRLWGANVWRRISGSRRNAVKRWRVTLGRNWRWWLGWVFVEENPCGLWIDGSKMGELFFADESKMISPTYLMYSHVLWTEWNIQWITRVFSPSAYISKFV